jgi:EmrB/QacA subfamily drug resistance transporter
MANRLTRKPCDAAVILSSRTIAPCAPDAAPWILAATILGSSLSFIDSSVVNLALPSLQGYFAATVTDMQWVIEAYSLLLAALMLVGGSLGDIYGRKRVFAIGITVFAAASTWCGFAPTVRHLIAGRVVQGIGAALLVPGSLSIIGASFLERDRGRAIGTWSSFTSANAAAGPALGGFLIEHASWRWVFLINLPLAAAALLITWMYVPESRTGSHAGSLDWAGGGLATLGLGGVTYTLIESSRMSWSQPWLIFPLLIGITALALFVIVEGRVAAPLVPLSLFRSRDFTGVNLVTLFLYGALSAVFFFFPLNLIQVQGYSATGAGAAMVPFILLMFLLSRWSGGIVDRYGARRPLIFGPILACVGFVMFAWPSVGGAYWTTFFPALVVLGLGMAVSVAPLTTAVMNSVPDKYVGTASGINNAVSDSADVLAIACFGILMVAVFNHHLSPQLAQLNLTPELRQSVADQQRMLAAIEIPDSVDVALRARIHQSVDESFVTGFRIVALISSVLALLAAGTAWSLIGRDKAT